MSWINDWNNTCYRGSSSFDSAVCYVSMSEDYKKLAEEVSKLNLKIKLDTLK